MDKIVLKQNNNFMDKTLWKSSESDEEGVVYEDIDGYVYRAGYKVPDKFDMLILLYMLYMSQQEGYKEEISFSRYGIIKACGFGDMVWYYKRLEDSLKRWLHVAIEFSGTFCDGKNYTSVGFHIIDDYKIDEKTKQVKVCFNPNWLLKVQVDQFFTLLDFNYYKALKGAVSRKLYELLRPFKDERRFKLTTLGKRLWLSGHKIDTTDGVKEVHFASHVLAKVKPAINEINKLSRKTKLLKEMGVNPKDAFRVKYEILGKDNKRVIVLRKEPIALKESEEEKQTSSIAHNKKPTKKPSVQSQTTKPPVQTSDNPLWKEAIAWIEGIPSFHADRLEDIKRLPENEVALIYPYIKRQYEKGKFKEGYIFKAFQSRWYLGDAKKALLEAERREEERKKQVKANEAFEKKGAASQSLYERLSKVVEKHGGRDKALYQGHPIVAFNHGFISILIDKERKSLDLDKVEEVDFSSPKERK